MRLPNPPSIEAYLAALDDSRKAALTRVVAAIRIGLPGAEESISYGIPTFRIGGHAVLYCAAFTAHYSIYPATAALVASLGDALAPGAYNGKGTIRFPLEVPVPAALIARIAGLRGAEDAAQPRRRAAAKKR
jgi:uncharacterized protein YdhG (YjbR/CyaY superfamily)